MIQRLLKTCWLGQVLLRSLLMRNLFKSYRLFTMKSVLLIHMLPHTLNRCMMHDAHTSSYEQSAIAAARKAGGNNYTTSGMPNTETRSSGGGGSEKNYGYDDLPTSEPSSTGRNSTLLSLNDFEDTETLEKSRVESGME